MGMMFRMRPHATDPNKMFYDIWMFELVPAGEEWPERPRHQRFRHGDRSIGQVLDQDAFNLPTVQKGMHATHTVDPPLRDHSSASRSHSGMAAVSNRLSTVIMQ